MSDVTQPPGQLTRFDPGPPPATEVRQSDNFLSAILAAATDPNVDASKVETLANLAVKLQDRERETEFNRDLNAAIMEMPVITKDGRIVIRKPGEPEREQGRFARLEDIDRVVRPIASRHNLAYSWDVGDSGQGPVVAIILTHANGFQVTSSGMKMPLDTSGGKNNVQGAGSAVTYGKRYTLCARFNIQVESADDDGNLGTANTVHLTHEREQTVLSEAEAAFAAGTYGEFFSRQSPKDRGWLISSGKHVEFGGQVQLPSSKPIGRTDGAPATPAGDSSSAKPRMTATQWVEGFERDVLALQSEEALDEYADQARDSLDKIKKSSEALWKRAQDAVAARREAIQEGRLV